MAARWIRPFAVAATLGIAGVASATHNEPISAKKLSLSLVTSYSACSGGPNTTTVLLPLPACDPPVRNDSVCSFGAKGSVKAGVSGSGATETIKFSVKAADITGCEGQTLALVRFGTPHDRRLHERRIVHGSGGYSSGLPRGPLLRGDGRQVQHQGRASEGHLGSWQEYRAPVARLRTEAWLGAYLRLRPPFPVVGGATYSDQGVSMPPWSTEDSAFKRAIRTDGVLPPRRPSERRKISVATARLGDGEWSAFGDTFRDTAPPAADSPGYLLVREGAQAGRLG